MATQGKAQDFVYGIFVAIIGSLLVSSIIEIDDNIFGNGSRLALGYWGFMFIVSSIAFFQVSKRILKGYSVQKSSLKGFDWATIICILLGIIVIVVAIAR
ncbi:hypothetical protein MUP01_08360 [Candidatus Bathyarchaeota archaeon]|nr:hypothetical protein [Candidatus Bathyarchaeota archaeon]